jgi:exoribonuclease II
MTHVLFEEDGSFKAATVLSEAGASLQVEHPSGRRAKVKAAHVMLRFDAPAPAEMMAHAQQLAQTLDVGFLWECAPQDEFDFGRLAGEYFGHKPTPAEATALLLALHAAPVYFHRKGRGRYRPAPREVLQAALAALERKRQQEETVEQDALSLVEGRLPESIARQAALLLVCPDKMSLEWRALDRACSKTHQAPERLLLAAGAFASARHLHRDRFTAEWFPHGTGFPASAIARDFDVSQLPLAEIEPFSIDDSTTTEIDDCLSVTPRPEGGWRVGIHIAAPGLAIAHGQALDLIARERMSTVYMPGEKITMLPDQVVSAFSLDEGREVAALSLYFDVSADATTLSAPVSRAERIRVAANLRHDQLDGVFTEAALDDPQVPLPFGEAMRVLWRVACARTAQRERVRGKPEPRFRTDFSFYVEGEAVRIVARRRDAPLDRIVAEMAILANCQWGAMLADHGLPGIYRSQQQGRVRTTAHPLPHQGLGVPQYMWATSPLRRYVDLVNQRQLLAALRGEAAPFAENNDTELFAVMTAFDARLAAYADFQLRMERYWCLRWLSQQALSQLEAVVIRDDLVRLADAPLYFRLTDLPALAPGRRVNVQVLDTDEVGVDLSARFLNTVDSAVAGADTVEADSTEGA